MSRFKEGRRIEDALKSGNEKEIHWAIGYCKMRLKLATMKYHIKHWEKLITELNKSLASEE